MNTVIEPRSGAALNRHRSFQAYETPQELIQAIVRRFGKIQVDLAASKENAKAPVWIDEAQNSLSFPWHELKGNLFLNPPYNDIAPWAKKCAQEMQKPKVLFERILFLVPASVGSNWFADHVDPYAQVLFLRPRLSFDGKNPYPKDTMLCNYDPNGLDDIQFECWKWK